MQNVLLTIFCNYGKSVSDVSLHCGLMKDIPVLEHAVQVKNHKAEMRHRTNEFADGKWVLLGNSITVSVLAGLCKKEHRGKA